MRTDADVDEVRAELVDRYGAPPEVVESLLFVARFRARCRQVGVSEVTLAGKYVRFAPVDLPDSRVVRLQRLHPRSIVKAPVSTILVPRPQPTGFPVRPVAGVALLEWARGVIDEIVDRRPRAGKPRSTPRSDREQDPPDDGRDDRPRRSAADRVRQRFAGRRGQGRRRGAHGPEVDAGDLALLHLGR